MMLKNFLIRLIGKDVLNHVKDLEKQIDLLEMGVIDRAVNSLRFLDQNKVYIIKIDGGAGNEEITIFKSFWNKIRSRIRWTLPEIVIVNKGIEELTLKEVEEVRNKLIKIKKEV